MEQQREHNEVGLRELAATLWKRKWMIMLVTLLAVSTSGIISFYVLTPQYEASTEIPCLRCLFEDAGHSLFFYDDGNVQLIHLRL